VHQHLLGERRQVEELIEFSERAQDSRLELRSILRVSVAETVRPVAQLSQVPQNTDRHVTAWSPASHR